MDLTDPWDPFCVARARLRTSGVWGLRMKSMVHARIAAVRAIWDVNSIHYTQARMATGKDDSLLPLQQSKR